ncbi:MAG: hypothetical protein AUJ51_06565 [Elusimicrobia bacterium CG1_02_56_21]|nr:MAG: hypothetical protein AUJ51_06565 [Elusimicrobia bacterium CG1_02_56_21]
MNDTGSKQAEILIAESSPTQAEQLKYLLENKGYKTACARNGREALAWLAKNLPTLVVSDIMMPEMNGFELCRKIKTDPRLRALPVILLTTLTGPEDILRGLECGADSFINKPCEEQYLLSRINYILLNLELHRSATAEPGLEITIAGEKQLVTASRIQILGLLLSACETAVRENRALQAAKKEIGEALEKVKTLGGLIPICAKCKKIRDDQGYWQDLETYMTRHSEMTFTHGYCADCLSAMEQGAAGKKRP